MTFHYIIYTMVTVVLSTFNSVMTQTTYNALNFFECDKVTQLKKIPTSMNFTYIIHHMVKMLITLVKTLEKDLPAQSTCMTLI